MFLANKTHTTVTSQKYLNNLVAIKHFLFRMPYENIHLSLIANETATCSVKNETELNLVKSYLFCTLNITHQKSNVSRLRKSNLVLVASNLFGSVTDEYDVTPQSLGKTFEFLRLSFLFFSFAFSKTAVSFTK